MGIEIAMYIWDHVVKKIDSAGSITRAMDQKSSNTTEVMVLVKTINIKQHTDSVIVGQSLVRDKQSRVHLMCILIAIDGIISGLLVKAMTAV